MLGPRILEADQAGDEVIISTELDRDLLQEVVHFFVSGFLPNASMSKAIVKAFNYFGINLLNLKFTEVKRNEDVQVS